MDHNQREHLLSIGEMAKTNRVSIATLRFYDQMGLLKPSYRDEASNYRYYDICQTASGEGDFSTNRGHRDPAWYRDSFDG